MRKLTKAADIQYDLAYDFESAAPIPSPSGSVSVWITAPVVGTDGLVKDDRHEAWLFTLRVTKKSVRAVFDIRSVVRRGEKISRNSYLREFTLPRQFSTPAARKAERAIAERLSFVLCPQRMEMFRGAPTKELCKRVHDYLVVHEVMET